MTEGERAVALLDLLGVKRTEITTDMLRSAQRFHEDVQALADKMYVNCTERMVPTRIADFDVAVDDTSIVLTKRLARCDRCGVEIPSGTRCADCGG